MAKRRFLVVFLPAVTIIPLITYFTFFADNSANVSSSFRDKERPDTPHSTNNVKTILLWTPVFGERKAYLSDCPLKKQCRVIHDVSQIHDADAVVFHPQDVIVEQLPPRPTTPTQKFVFWSMESPLNFKAILQKLPKNYFHWTMTPLSISTVHHPYGGYWVPPKLASERGFPPEQLDVNEEELFRDKTIKGVFWLVSNCQTPSGRERAIDALSEHIRVDIAGKCAKNDTMRDLCPPGNTCEDVFRHYYFFIAVENANCRDYVTEKYWSRYHLPLIPIVMRKSIYARRIPPNSYIAMDDYTNPKALADHLNSLMENRTAYMKYFQWRREGWARAPWNTHGYRIGQCRLCERLLNESSQKAANPIADIAKWYVEESNCEADEFTNQWTKA